MDDGYLLVGLLPGIFANEYTAILNVHGREVSSTIPKERVKVDQEPAGGVPGSGRLTVHIVGEREGVAIVDLPSPAFTSEPRLEVSLDDLIK